MMRYLLRPCWLVGLCFVAAACDAGTPEAPPAAAQAQVPSAVHGEPTAAPPVLVAIEPMPSSRAAHSATRLRDRSEEHTSELQSLMRISYAVFCLNTKTKH